MLVQLCDFELAVLWYLIEASIQSPCLLQILPNIQTSLEAIIIQISFDGYYMIAAVLSRGK